MAQFSPSTEVDFVVIGSGAGGGIMAKQLSVAGFSVVVLEQGGWGKYGKEHEYTKDEYLNDAGGMDFLEIYVDVPLDVAEQRDPKGLYKKARAGEIPEFTGVSDPYEAPLAPEVVVPTHDRTVAESAALVLEYLDSVGLSAP